MIPKKLEELINKYPNNYELGEEVRKYYYKHNSINHPKGSYIKFKKQTLSRFFNNNKCNKRYA